MSNFNLKKNDVSYRILAKKRIQDNADFYQNHLKTMTEGDNVSQMTIDASDLEAGSDFFDFKEKEFKFIKFNEVNFGKDNADNDDDYVKVINTCFYYCDFSLCGFSNISFENSSFVGCNFSECYVLGLSSIFSNCSFVSRIMGKKNLDDAPSMFDSCELTFRFIGCDFTQVVFTKTNFYFCDFHNTNFYDAILVDCSLDITKMSDCDLRSTKILNPKVIEFYIEDKQKRTKVNAHTFLGKINYSKKEAREIRFANEVYGIFSELFETNKIMELFGEYFYLTKRTEHDMLSKKGKLISYAGLITCGYGERPVYSLFTSIFIIIVCGTFYMFLGLSGNNETLILKLGVIPPFNKFVMWYHFSLVTFTTTGYGNVTPLGGSLYVSAIEMVSGVVMIGIWVSTLVRKMAR